MKNVIQNLNITIHICPSLPVNKEFHQAGYLGFLQLAEINWAYAMGKWLHTYRQISNIGRTKSQHLDVPRLVLQLSLPKPLKPGVKLRMKM